MTSIPGAVYPGFVAPPANGEASSGATEGWPAALAVSTDEALRGLNPLQHVPVVGMIYRAITGETIPMTMRVLGAGLVGGPVGMAGAVLMGLAEELFSMSPDQSRPAAPAGMLATGAEAGMQPVTPGTTAPGQYTTLATTEPAFLSGRAGFAQAGQASYQRAELEWRRAELVEKGIA